jgi:hypothetical protein
LCDVDADHLAGEAKKFSDAGETVARYRDARALLEDKDIDAVVIATPNHWHALLGIWACQAGKDVYVEKPISHNIWEGRKLVEAARKYDRIVQAGTQNRSDTGFRAAIAYLHTGELGEIKWAYGLWYKERDSIGKVDQPQAVPDSVDYDLWTGPAEMGPLWRKNLHYDWHWFWDTGSGDMGNLGAHQIDDCRFAMNLGVPDKVLSFGNRFLFNDDGQTPNTQMVLYDYQPAPVMIEIRNLPMAKGVRAMDHLRGVRAGNIIQCEDGYFAGGRGGGWIFDNAGKKVKQFPGDGGATHQANFITAVRDRDSGKLHADILEGHTSAALCHMANISYRLGEATALDKIRQNTDGYPEVETIFERLRSHLVKNAVSLHETPLICGPWLSFNAQAERFEGDMAERANSYLTRGAYREPFVVPNQV